MQFLGRLWWKQNPLKRQYLFSCSRQWLLPRMPGQRTLNDRQHTWPGSNWIGQWLARYGISPGPMGGCKRPGFACIYRCVFFHLNRWSASSDPQNAAGQVSTTFLLGTTSFLIPCFFSIFLCAVSHLKGTYFSFSLVRYKFTKVKKTSPGGGHYEGNPFYGINLSF